jgi:menaquinone-dependent protoporphyrinogen oxidase
MKTAVIYATNHGTTEKVAQMIREQLGEDNADLINLKNNPMPDLSDYDQVFLGGSIHAGNIQNRVKKFYQQNMVDLLGKPLALFLCGMNKQQFQEEFDGAFPEVLRKHAISKKMVGGEFLFDKMNFIEKALVRKISGINETVSDIEVEKIRELVTDMQNS